MSNKDIWTAIGKLFDPPKVPPKEPPKQGKGKVNKK